MSNPARTRVFILGAGCSADCGYPLGRGLAVELEAFLSKISGRLPMIEQCVRDTINLAKGPPQFDTLDQLAKHLEDDLISWKQKRAGWDAAYNQREHLYDKQLVAAKIAVSTMFLAAEEKARATGLQSYGRIVSSIFGGEHWHDGVKAANCHVLTFNYDRLFEIAFLDHFKSFGPCSPSLYGNRVLNSGFNDQVPGGFDKVEPKTGFFSFLKLHGSAGWWVRPYKGTRGKDELRHYWPCVPQNVPANLPEIETFLEKRQPWEPLITFPHEKQRSMRRRTDFPYDPYIQHIWDHAARLLATATEIRVIGYSFSAIDCSHMVSELLSKASQCRRIVIQIPKEGLNAVKANLASHAQLNCLEFDPSRFGENL